VIEEGTVPLALARFYEAMLELMPQKTPPTGENTLKKVQSLLARQGSKFLGPYFSKSSTEKTQVYLIMSHDSMFTRYIYVPSTNKVIGNQAILTLQNDKPMLKFSGVGNSEHVKQLDALLANATTAIGGTYEGSPFYAAFGQQEITVHAMFVSPEATPEFW